MGNDSEQRLGPRLQLSRIHPKVITHKYMFIYTQRYTFFELCMYISRLSMRLNAQLKQIST